MQGVGQLVCRQLMAGLIATQGNAFSHQANALVTISRMMQR